MLIEPSVKHAIKTSALQAIASRSTVWEPLVHHLETIFEETHSGVYLLELCKLKFNLGDWEYVANHSADLVKIVQSSTAFRLALYALRNARRYDMCLELLNQYKVSFADEMPSDLWRLEIDCKSAIDLPSALSSARTLAHREPSTENTLILIETLHRMGDLRGVAVIARDLLDRKDVSPRVLLWLAKWVYVEDRELAKEFWRRAKPDVTNDPDLLAFAILLSSPLGLDKETSTLFQKMTEYAAQGVGPIKAFTLEEFPTWMEQRAQYLHMLNLNYAKGSIPIHIVSNEVGITLAEVLHLVPEENRKASSLATGVRVFIRHGGKPVNQKLTQQLNDRRLHMDITSILLAEDLAILSKVERCFGPIFISPDTTKSLNYQRTELTSYQRSQLSVFRKIVELLKQEKLSPFPDLPKTVEDISGLKSKMGERWVAILRRAIEEDAFVVEYLPLKHYKPPRKRIVLPRQIKARMTNCRAVLEGLKTTGALSTNSYEQAIEKLGSESNAENQTIVPPIGAKLFLVGNIVDFLINADIIDLVCERFQVYLDPIHIDEATYATERTRKLALLESWMELLTGRLNSGLASGAYRVIRPPQTAKEVVEADERINLDFKIATHLLQYEVNSNDVLCFDDRSLNSFSSRDNIVPIIGMSEILETLRLQGELTEAEYYDKLLRLRAGNMRYVPIGESEIQYHLKQAQIGPNGNLIETPELAILRRYFSACFLDTDSLQRPPMPEGFANKSGEMAFVSQVTQGMVDAILSAWSDESSTIQTAKARSEYVLKNLFTGLFGAIHLIPNPEIRGDGLNEIGIDFGSLLGGALTFGIKNVRNLLKGEGNEIRKEFLNWFEKRALLPRLKADPNAIDTIVPVLANLLVQGKDDSYDPPELETYYRAYKAFFYDDLPPSIKERLGENQELSEWLKIETVEAVPLGAAGFKASEYWEAAESAYNGQVATIRSLNTSGEFTFRRTEENGEVGFEILNNTGKVIRQFRDPILELLSRNIERREAILRANRLWFECSHNEFEYEVITIAAETDIRRRLDRTNAWRTLSAEYYYQNLERKLTSTNRFLWTDLLPEESSSLSKHLRMEPTDGETAYDQIVLGSTELLIAEQGLDAALSRLSCLPINMPDTLLERFRGLAEEEKLALLDRYRSQWISPVSRLNLIVLSLRSGLGDSVIVESARCALNELFDDHKGKTLFEAFESILLYLNTELGYSSWFNALPVSLKLTMLWAHACRLHNVFSKSGAESEEIVRLFTQGPQPISTDIFEREPTFWNDVLHPHRLNREVFLTHGVARVLGRFDERILKEISADEIVGKLISAEDAAENIVHLIRDSTLATNRLNSFLGGDRARSLLAVIDEDNAKVFGSSNLHDLVLKAINELKTDPSQPHWGTIHAIVGDLPIYEDLQLPLKELLTTLDFEPLFEPTSNIVLFSLRTAASQVPYLSDDTLRSKLENDLFKIATLYSELRYSEGGPDTEDNSFGFSSDRVIAGLLEAALDLSVRLNDPRATTRAWAQLLQRLIDIWGPIGNYVAPSISQMIFQLPARQLQGLWPLLLTLRATQSKSL